MKLYNVNFLHFFAKIKYKTLVNNIQNFYIFYGFLGNFI